MNDLLLIFGVPSAVVILMHELEILGYRVYPIIVRYLSFKPFTCELCLTFWCYFWLKYFTTGINIEALAGAFISSAIAYLLSIKFIKF